MPLYDEQIKRIKEKLLKARKRDKELQVFGAESHKYKLYAPATPKSIASFETQYGIVLPDCYRSFLLHVGNGGISYSGSAAGPFYGIYALGDEAEALTGSNHLMNECVLYPGMPDHAWRSLNAILDANDDVPVQHISDEEYEEELGKVFGGILPIGSQGCTYLHGIVLNGPYKGRVVNLDSDRERSPQFTYEHNFLDWYERWLDEVISGELLSHRLYWFGYTMGGSEEELVRSIDSDSVVGLLNKATLTKTTLDIVEAHLPRADGRLKKLLIKLLAKHDYDRARPHLTALAQTDIGTVCKITNHTARQHIGEWVPLIFAHIAGVEDPHQFRDCTYVLSAAATDFGDVIVPFTEKADQELRITAYYTLGKLADKEKYLAVFIKGLSDPVDAVVHSTLQALSGIKNDVLLVHYKRIAEKYTTDVSWILTNLDYRLQDYGLDRQSILK